MKIYLTDKGFVLAIALLLLAPVLVARAIYRARKGPVAHIPGPASSKWTRLPLKKAIITGQRTVYVHELDQRYGPVFRLSPTEVSLADINATRVIYKVGGPYLKSDWYPRFTASMPYRNLFDMIDFHKHAQHWRLLAANFAEKWIANLEPYMSRNVRLAIARMSGDVKTTGYCDIFKWFTFMETDIIEEATFGESFHMLTTGKTNQCIRDVETFSHHGVFRVEFPMLFKLMRQLPFGPSKDIAQAVKRVLEYSEESIQRYWKQLQTDPDNAKPTLLTKEFAAVEDGTMPAGQLRRDGVGNIVAGTDEFAITATYAVWLLSHLPAVEQDMIREVAALPENFTDNHLRPLKLLNNVINETLRLRGPLTQNLPRIVPFGGAEFLEKFLPAGTEVGIHAYTLHRDPDVWTNPETFDPSRWDSPTKDMLDSFRPFGGGSRVCIGSHFAQLELRHALANFYRTFEFGVRPVYVDGFTDDDMVPVNFFLNPPKGERCLVEPRK